MAPRDDNKVKIASVLGVDVRDLFPYEVALVP